MLITFQLLPEIVQFRIMRNIQHNIFNRKVPFVSLSGFKLDSITQVKLHKLDIIRTFSDFTAE